MLPWRGLVYCLVLGIGPHVAGARCPDVDAKVPVVALSRQEVAATVTLTWGLECFCTPTSLGPSPNWTVELTVLGTDEAVVARTEASVFRADTPLRPLGTLRQPLHLSTVGLQPLTFQTRLLPGPDPFRTQNATAWNATSCRREVRVIPWVLTFVPPVFCITLAVLTQQPLIAMAVSLWLANVFIYVNPVAALSHTFTTYIAGGIAEDNHAELLVFTFMISGLIGILARSGGIFGLTDAISRLATSSTRLQLCLWVAGISIFFSDYGSCLLVGSTMRAMADRMHVSREKAAFIVDSTSAPISSLTPVSAWAAYETGLIAAGLRHIGDTERDPYMLFLATVPYRFYPILIMVFGLMLVLLRRDYYVMSLFERHARSPEWTPGSPPLARLKAEVQRPGHKQKASGPKEWAKLSQTPAATELADRKLSVVTDGAEDETPHDSSLPVEPSIGGANGSVAPEPEPAAASERGRAACWGRCWSLCTPGEAADGAEDAGDDLQPKPGIPRRWYNAAGPIGALLAAAFGGMPIDGYHVLLAKRARALEQGLLLGPDLELTARNMIQSAGALRVMLLACVFGTFVAVAMVVLQRLLTMKEVMEAWATGVKSTIVAMCILAMAWGLGDVIQDLHTAPALVSLVGPAVNPGLIPVIIFGFSCLVSFCTGTSWGTMSIVFPIAVPLIHSLVPGDTHLLTATISSILAGAVFGDHCSPFSDTTILTAMACGCDVMTHVRTQMPYAVTAAVVALVFGDMAVGLGLYPLAVAYPVAVVALLACVLGFGHRVPVHSSAVPVAETELRETS